MLRLRPKEKSGGAFATEEAIYRRLSGQLPVPEVIAVDLTQSAIDADYMLTRRLPGQSLTSTWLSSSAAQREWWVDALAEMLRVLHSNRFPSCGGFDGGDLQPATSWQNYFATRFERRLRIVRQFPSADRELIDAIEAAWLRGAPALGGDDDARLVHRDIHFGNILVEERRITAILDFEAAVAGPVDYELDQLFRFFRYPQLFVEPRLESSATRRAFETAAPGLRKAYPELFVQPRLEERLCLYSLEYDLAALRDCYTGRWGAEAHAHVRSRIAAALHGQAWP